MSSLTQLGITYGVGSTAVFAWVINFLAVDDYSRRVRNVATSGLVETVLESPDVLVSWTIPALQVGADYEQWATFYRWAAAGGQFAFAPCYPASPKIYNATLDDKAFMPKRAGWMRYSLDCTIRIVPDGAAPADVGEVMHAFWGLA